MRVLAVLRTLAYMVVFFLGWGWVARAARGFDSDIGIRLPSWLSPSRYAIFVAGLVVLVVFVLRLPLRGLGTPAPFDASRRLIVSGPCRFVRNPIYLASLLALAGYGLAVGSLSVLLLAAVTWLLTHALVVLYEEPHSGARSVKAASATLGM